MDSWNPWKPSRTPQAEIHDHAALLSLYQTAVHSTKNALQTAETPRINMLRSAESITAGRETLAHLLEDVSRLRKAQERPRDGVIAHDRRGG